MFRPLMIQHNAEIKVKPTILFKLPWKLRHSCTVLQERGQRAESREPKQLYCQTPDLPRPPSPAKDSTLKHFVWLIGRFYALIWDVLINHFWLCSAVVSHSQPQSKCYKTLKRTKKMFLATSENGNTMTWQLKVIYITFITTFV